MKTDEQLMLAYAAGDESAFEELFGRVGGQVSGYMRGGYQSEDEARDLVQQTFLQLHRARRDFRADRPFRPWLMTIARNVLRDHLRAQRSRMKITAGRLLREIGSTPSPSIDQERLDAAIRRLPVSLRTIIEGRWKQERSYADLAGQLGTSVAAIKVRAHRAYLALRNLLTAPGSVEIKASVTGAGRLRNISLGKDEP